MPAWAWTIAVSDSVPGGDDHADERQALRDLVGDQLRGGAHRAEERVLRARGPAAEHQPVEGDRAEREHVQRADRRVDAVEARPACRRCPATSPNGTIANAATAVMIEMTGASANRQPIDVPGGTAPWSASLHDVGERLQRGRTGRRGSGRSGSGSARAACARDDHQRQDPEDDGEDHDRLEDLDPPRLVVAERASRSSGELGLVVVSVRADAVSTGTGTHVSDRLRLGSALAPSRRCPSSRKTRAGRRSRRAARTVARTASAGRRRATTRPAVAVAQAEALRVGGRQLERAGAGAGTAAPARPRPRARPRSSGRCPGAGRRVALAGAASGRGAVGRGSARRARPRRASRSCQRTPWPPISSSVSPA